VAGRTLAPHVNYLAIHAGVETTDFLETICLQLTIDLDTVAAFGAGVHPVPLSAAGLLDQ